MLIAEPIECARDRFQALAEQHRLRSLALRSARNLTAWDDAILDFLRPRHSPVHFMAVVNQMARATGPRTKQERIRLKLDLIHGLGLLIKHGKVHRYRRRFVMHPGCAPASPGNR